jgi:hypothetical protein
VGRGYVHCMVLTINSDYLPKRHKPVGLCSGDVVSCEVRTEFLTMRSLHDVHECVVQAGLVMSVSVCLSVCQRVELWNSRVDFYEILVWTSCHWKLNSFYFLQSVMQT